MLPLNFRSLRKLFGGGADGEWDIDATLAREASGSTSIEINGLGKVLEAVACHLAVGTCRRLRIQALHTTAATCRWGTLATSCIRHARGHSRRHVPTCNSICNMWCSKEEDGNCSSSDSNTMDVEASHCRRKGVKEACGAKRSVDRRPISGEMLWLNGGKEKGLCSLERVVN